MSTIMKSLAAALLFATGAMGCTANVSNPSLNQMANMTSCTTSCDDAETSCSAKCSDDSCRASCTTTHSNCVEQCAPATTTGDGGT